MAKRQKHLIISMMVFIVVAVLWTAMWAVKNSEFSGAGNKNINEYKMEVSLQTANKDGSAADGVDAVVWAGEEDGFKCFIYATQSTSNCSKKYPADSIVFLYENVYEGGLFKGWASGSCDEINEIDGQSVCTLEISGDRKVVAIFENDGQ